MPKFLASLAILTIVSAIEMCSPQIARGEGINDSYIGPAVTFDNDKTTLGVSAKLPAGGNFALRPYLEFTGGRIPYGASLTYSLPILPSLTPYIGYGFAVDNNRNSNVSGFFNLPNVSGFFNLGLDANLSDKLALFTSVTIPTSQEVSGRIVVGTSLRF